jgi:hypothetical protein
MFKNKNLKFEVILDDLFLLFKILSFSLSSSNTNEPHLGQFLGLGGS